MNWHYYEIELVTDCLCAGADQQKAEIRVPSIRGQVRWWFRALGGTREEEKELFGGVLDKAQRSQVVFRLGKAPACIESQNMDQLLGPQAMKDARSYLIWPLRSQRRGVIPAGRVFSLNWTFRGGFQNALLEAKFKDALHSWLLLGALGTRSRRGYGSLVVKDSSDLTASQSKPEFMKCIAESLKTFRNPRLVVVALAEGYASQSEAMKFLGEWLRRFRVGKDAYGIAASPWGKNDHDAGIPNLGVDKVYRPVIGLPLEQRYDGGKRIVVTKFEDKDRWASPVHLKVTRCGNRYFPIAVFFLNMVIPKNSKVSLEIKHSGRKPWNLPVDHGLLEAMMKPGPGGQVLYPA